MTRIRQVFTEALDPINKVINSIIKKLNYVESHIILKANDYTSIADYLNDTCGYHSNTYNELPPDMQDKVAEGIYNRIHKILGNKPVTEDTNSLEQKIYEYLKVNGGIMYPLEMSAKKLADAIRNKPQQ